MRMSAEALYALLPAIHRSRDAAEGYPLRALIAVIAEQAAVVEETIEQLYDDQFIETCADWVAPYIGALIGYRPLHGEVPAIASPRAEVANTIAYRRRLGTASVLEQLARDVTGWPASAVEYFRHVATTQRMNHIRPDHAFAPDLRDGIAMAAIGGGFDRITRLADVRSIARADGRIGLANVGIHLWRLTASSRTDAPATAVDARRFLFSPLGAPLPLFTRPRDEDAIAHAATPLDVPAPIGRRALDTDLAGPCALYGRDPAGVAQSLLVSLDGVELAAAEVECCNLADDGGGWANMPAAGGRVSIDPVLGRIALPPDRIGAVRVSYHHGFPAPIGGGEYERAAAFAEPTPARPRLIVPSADFATIQSALDALPAAGGIVEIVGSGHHAGPLTITAAPAAAIDLRAANGACPHVALAGDLIVTGGADARVTIDGLLLSAGAVRVPEDGANRLGALTLRHCTLVPGRTLDPAGRPVQPGAMSLEIDIAGVKLALAACISGPLAIAADSAARIEDSLIDAAAPDPLDSPEGVAYAAPGGADFGGALTLLGVTVFGKVAATRLDLVSNSILVSRRAAGDAWPATVWAERRQIGCVRFSWLPPESLVPPRHRCQPQLAIDDAIAARATSLNAPVPAVERAAIAARQAARIVPAFTSRRYGRPAYAQLRTSVPREIVAGADDEGEMGGFHLLFAPQRATNLNIRLDEYLRFDLEAGIFYET